MTARVALLLLSSTLLVAGCDTLHARHLANSAVALYRSGDFQGAAEKFDRAVELDPRIPTIFLNQGFTYLALYTASPKSKEGYEAGGRAVRAFQRYLALAPDDPRGKNYLVQTFVDTNRYEDAVAYFKPEIERQPPSLAAVTTLGLIASKTGRIDDALNWYQRRVALAPADPDGHYSLGVLIWEHLHYHSNITGQERLALSDQALGSLRKAVELRPHAFESYTYINLVYRERIAGESAEAAKMADLREAERYQKIALEKTKDSLTVAKAVNP